MPSKSLVPPMALLTLALPVALAHAPVGNGYRFHQRSVPGDVASPIEKPRSQFHRSPSLPWRPRCRSRPRRSILRLTLPRSSSSERLRWPPLPQETPIGARHCQTTTHSVLREATQPAAHQLRRLRQWKLSAKKFSTKRI